MDANLLAFETRLDKESMNTDVETRCDLFYWFHLKQDNKKNKQRQRSIYFHFKTSCIFVKHLKNEVERVNKKHFKRVGCCRCRAVKLLKTGRSSGGVSNSISIAS